MEGWRDGQTKVLIKTFLGFNPKGLGTRLNKAALPR